MLSVSISGINIISIVIIMITMLPGREVVHARLHAARHLRRLLHRLGGEADLLPDVLEGGHHVVAEVGLVSSCLIDLLWILCI